MHLTARKLKKKKAREKRVMKAHNAARNGGKSHSAKVKRAAMKREEQAAQVKALKKERKRLERNQAAIDRRVKKMEKRGAFQSAMGFLKSVFKGSQ